MRTFDTRFGKTSRESAAFGSSAAHYRDDCLHEYF